MKWCSSFWGILLAVLPSMAQEPVTIDLDHADGLLITAPEGYGQASFSFGAVPDGQSTNGLGLIVLLQSGDGLLLYGPSVETGEGVVLIECSVWTDSPNVFLALVGLNSPVNGSLIANMPANGEDYQGSWHRMEVLYDPKDDAVMPAFQVVATGDGTTTVYLDQIVVTPLRMSGEQLKEIIPAPSTITVNLPGIAEGAKPLDMVLIPAGTFTMGSPVDEQDRYPDEGPQHEVTISKPFYMGKYEVTNAQFRVYRSDHDSQDYSGFTLNSDDQPVVNLIWDDAVGFCQWLEQQNPGMEFRLPTEAEWEYACRAGTAERFYWGDDADYSEAEDYSWHTGNSGGPSHTVGLKLPNPWDLYDMSGNVWEWCSDWLGSYSSDAQIDPLGPSSGTSHVLRGGSSFDIQRHLRSAYRSGPPPGGPHVLVGFRVVSPRVE